MDEYQSKEPNSNLQQSNTLPTLLNIDLKQETDEDVEDDELREVYDYTSLVTVEMEVVEESTLMEKQLYKVGCDSGDGEQMTVNLDDPSTRVGCDNDHEDSQSASVKLHRYQDMSLTSECDVETKTEIYPDEFVTKDLAQNVRLKKPVEDKYEGREFACGFCEYKAKTKWHLTMHVRVKHDENAEWYRCECCDFKTKRQSSLKKHFTSKHDEQAELFGCQVCNYVTKNPDHLKLHFNVKHNEKAQWYNCESCDFKTKRKSILSKHFTIRHDKQAEKYHCEFCDYITKNPDNLKQHCNRRHGKELQWKQCQLCDFRTQENEQLKLHFKAMHGDEGPWYQCPICDFKTKRNLDLKRHYNEKHPKQYQCQFCDYKTRLKYMFRDHIRRYHNEEDADLITYKLEANSTTKKHLH